MLQAGEADQSNTGVGGDLTTVVCSNEEGQSRLTGEVKIKAFPLSLPLSSPYLPTPLHFFLSPFLPSLCPLLIGAIKVCLHAHGNDLAEIKTFVRQDKRRNF